MIFRNILCIDGKCSSKMVTEIVLSALFCGAALLLAGRLMPRETTRGQDISPAAFGVVASLLFLSAFTLRLVLAYTSEGFSTDMETFKAWAYALNTKGFQGIYNQQDYFIDYPPGYLYVLWFLDKLRAALNMDFGSGYTLLLKLPSLLADLACAGCLLWAGKKKLGSRQGLFLSALYLFCPVVLVNSAQWGQVDSVTTAILLCSVLLLYKEHYVPSALLYGLSVACKPQMLIFAPLYLFFVIRQRKWLQLLLGVASGLGIILLLALPFADGLDFSWLIDKYRSTMDYYNYYTVNAYNFWTVIGWNWKALPEGAAGTALTLLAPVLATAACGALLLFSRRKDVLFVCPVALMSIMYLFGVKMHERYLYPIFLFLLLAFLFTPDKRTMRSFCFSGLANYLNVAHVLYLFREKGSNYDPNAPLTRCMAALQLLALGYTLYALWAVYLRGLVREYAIRKPRPWPQPVFADSRIRAADCVALAIIVLGYGLVAFWQLGSHETAVTSWTPEEGDSVVLHAEDGPCESLYYLPGIAPDSEHRGSRVGANIQVEVSEDGQTWIDSGNLTDSGSYVFTWYHQTLSQPANYVRLTAQDGSVVLNEAALKLSGQSLFSSVSVVSGNADALLDEQQVVPLYTTYQNSAYFDEIYHARTAYENILGLEPYENTHPPLGKYIISLGIRIFGMNPFGWRFMGTLFGVLMLPVLYHLLKQLFGKISICCAGTVLFAFDFMHFTQTRIATIDTYSVFFLLLMYDAMVSFLKRDIKNDSMRKLLPPLLCSGVFMGLGIAAKWTAAYGALGLAALYFGKLYLTLRDQRETGESLSPLYRKMGLLCAWCCLFFLVIPFAIYFVAFLPLTTLPHNIHDVFGTFVNYQVNMFNYHSKLVAEHYFASPWYEWPLDIRPIWYFSGDPVDAAGHYSTISCLGNPLLWWAGIPAILAAAVLWFRERKTYAAVVLCGFLSVYLPWVLVPRLTFIYHYFTAVPFLVIALCGAFQRLGETSILGEELTLAKRIKFSCADVISWGFTACCLVLFCVFFPVISGAPTDKSYTDALRLFPTWYF